jgi:hypothetical protein
LIFISSFLLLLAVQATPCASLPGKLPDPPPGRLYHGVFPHSKNGMGSDIRLSGVRAYAKQTGRHPAWVYFWNNWYQSRAFPGATATWIRQSGSIPYVRLMLYSSPDIPRPDPVFKLQNILDGKFDPDLRAWMRAARDFGTPILAEYGVEPNGWWFPWNGLYNREAGTYAESVARFRDVYRRIVRISREEGARNIRWVFHVDPWDEPVEDWNRFENYYPGDEWIDWVGVSVYGRQVPRDKRAVSFRYQMDWAYGRLTKLTDKPVIVCEFGSMQGKDQAPWAEAALVDLLGGRWPRLIGFAWWNSAFFNDPEDEDGESDMRLQTNPDLAKVFRSHFVRATNLLDRP